MEIISLSQARHFLREKPIRVSVVDRPRLSAELICLEPGQQDTRQSYDVSDNLYVVIEGEAYIRTEAQEFTLAVQDALVVPPGVNHWVHNKTEERLTVLAFVAPKPARASEVRMPRQQRDFSRPRRDFREADDRSQLISEEEELANLLGEPSDDGEMRETSEERAGGERRFPERGQFNGPRRDFGDRPQGPRRDFGPPRSGGSPERIRGAGRREFAGGHESRPRRDFSGRPSYGNGPQRSFGDSPRGPRPFNDRQGGPSRDFGDRPQGPRRDFGDRPQGPRRDFGDRPQGPRRDFGDRPQGPRRDFGDRPQGPRRDFGDRPQGPRRDYGDRPQGPRSFNERPPQRRDGYQQEDDRPRRRPPVSPNFVPRKPNQTGGNREFPTGPNRSRGGFGSRPGGQGNRTNRPATGRNGRPGPNRNGPRTSGRRPAP